MASRNPLRLIVMTAAILALILIPRSLRGQTPVAVPTAGSSSVQVVDLDSGSLLGNYPVGGDGYGLAVQRDGRRSYVSQVHATGLSAFQHAPVAVQTVAQGFTMHGIGLAPDGRTLYATVRDGGQVAVLDALTLQEVTRIDGLANPGGVYVDPQARYVAISSYGVPWLMIYDLQTGRKRYAQLPGTGGWSIAATANGNRLYVQTASGYVAEIDPILAGTLSTLSAPTVTGSIALTPDGSRLYLAAQGSVLERWSTQPLTALPSMPVGSAATVDVSPDGEQIWVIRSGSAQLTAYSVATDTPIRDVGVPGITFGMGRFVPSAPNATAIWDLDDNGLGLPGQVDLSIPVGATYLPGAIGRGALQCGAESVSASLDAPGTDAPFSLSLWIRPTLLPLTTALIAGQASNTVPAGWWLGLNGNRLQLNGFSTPALVANASVVAENWQHVAFSADASSVKLYLNGALVGSSSRSPVQTSATLFRLCADSALGASAFAGAIDNVASYSRALPAAEIQTLQRMSANVSADIPEPGFESSAANTVMNNISGWRFATSNRNDAGVFGSTPRGQWDARSVADRRHSGNASLRTLVRNVAGGGGTDADGRKATLSIGLPDDLRFANQAAALELWRSDLEWTTSARWYHRLLLTLGDSRTQHEFVLYCRAWGLNEGCDNNFYDGSDLTETGADGFSWYRHRIAIPDDLDRQRLWLRLEHQQDSWDGTTAESTVYWDDIHFVGRLPGSELATASFANNRVQFFGKEGNGNLLPTRSIAGPATQLNQPNGVAFSDTEVFVGNHAGQSITVYPRDATGNVAPTRVISGGNTGLGLVTHLRVFDGELWVASYGAALRVFNLTDSGNVAPKRVLNAMTSVYGLAVSDQEVFLSRHPDTGDQSIYVYPRTASGTAAPLRVLMGQGLNFPSGLALTATELVVSDYFNGALRVFPRQASGNVAASRVVTEAGALISPAEVWVRDNEIYVAARASNSLRIYGLNDQGEITARRSIAGGNTELSEPLSIIDSRAPVAPDSLFADGFEN